MSRTEATTVMHHDGYKLVLKPACGGSVSWCKTERCQVEHIVKLYMCSYLSTTVAATPPGEQNKHRFIEVSDQLRHYHTFKDITDTLIKDTLIKLQLTTCSCYIIQFIKVTAAILKATIKFVIAAYSNTVVM